MSPTLIVGLVGAAIAGVLTVRLAHEQKGRANDRAEWAKAETVYQRGLADISKMAADQAAATAKAYQALATEREEANRAFQAQVDRARDAARAADTSTGRVLDAYKRAADSRCRFDVQAATAAGAGEAEEAARVLADVPRRLAEGRRRYADIAEDALTRGELCERAYDGALKAAP